MGSTKKSKEEILKLIAQDFVDTIPASKQKSVERAEILRIDETPFGEYRATTLHYEVDGYREDSVSDRIPTARGSYQEGSLRDTEGNRISFRREPESFSLHMNELFQSMWDEEKRNQVDIVAWSDGTIETEFVRSDELHAYCIYYAQGGEEVWEDHKQSHNLSFSGVAWNENQVLNYSPERRKKETIITKAQKKLMKNGQ